MNAGSGVKSNHHAGTRSAGRLFCLTLPLLILQICALCCCQDPPTGTVSFCPTSSETPDLRAAVADPGPQAARWRSSWHHVLSGYDQVPLTTYRVRVRSGLAGSQVRVTFAAGLGNGWTLGRAFIGHALLQGTVDSDNVQMHFSGQAGATLKTGDRLVSDPVALPVAAEDDLYVTFTASYVVARSWVLPIEALSQAGDVADSARLNGGAEAAFAYGITALDVLTSSAVPAVACLGDSLTEGVGPTEADTSWPAQAEETTGTPWLNSGEAGDDLSEIIGTYGRIDPDLLDLLGVGQAVLLLGTNDLSRGTSATALLAGLDQIAASAKADGITVVKATIPPRSDMTWLLTPALEQSRQQVNAALRAAGPVVDFDHVLADPRNPARLRPAYDSGDGVHPTPLGYAAMARAAIARLN